MNGLRRTWGSLSVLLLLSSCVPREKWDQLVAVEREGRALADRDRIESAEAVSRHGEQIVDLTTALAASEKHDEQCGLSLDEAEIEKHKMRVQFDDSIAMGEQLRGELTRAGRDVNKLLADKGTLSDALGIAKTRLSELRQLEDADEVEKRLYDGLEHRLAPLIAAGQVRMEGKETPGGHPVLVLDGDLVFGDGKSEIRTLGRGAVMEIARVLSDTKGRHFFVTVYSDEKVRKGKALATWELSAARAVTLVRFFISLHVAPESLTSGGTVSMVASASSLRSAPESWQRRIEIAVLPEAAAKQ